MNISTKLFLLFLLFVFTGFSQINREIPKWVIMEDIKTIGNINNKEVKDGYYFVMANEQYNTILKQNFFHYATKATTEAGLSNTSQIEVSYDPSYQKAFIHFIKIHRGTTVIDKTNINDIKILNEENERSQGILNGNKTIYANLSDLRKGDIVEYCYSITGYNKIFQNYFSFDLGISYSVPVGRISGRVIFDKGTKINIINKNTDLQPKIVSGVNNDYSWSLNNPKITIVDNNTPNWYNPYPRIQISNIENWSTVKTWFSELFKLDNYNKSSIKAIADSIKIKYTDSEEQVSACVDFVQNHIRYSGNENGIYSHKPHDPEYVISNRFGDCKDKSLFLTKLLEYFNVKCYPVLLNTYLGTTIASYVPSMGKFDHCISVIDFKNKLYYIDPTITYQKGNFTKRTIPNYQLGMVLDGSDQIFSKILPDKLSTSEIIEDFEIDEVTGHATLLVKSIYNGMNADNIRYYFAANSLNDIQESYQSIYLKYTDDLEVIDSVRLVDNSNENTLVTYESYLLKDFWSNKKEADKNSISKDFLPYFLNEKIQYVDKLNRTDPFSLNYPVNAIQKINITKSGGWNIESKSLSEKNDFFDYQFNSYVTNSTLHLDYNFISNTEVVMPKDYSKYKEKTDFLDKNIVFSVSQAIVSEASTNGFNWLLLVTMLLAVGVSIFICFNLNSISRKTQYEKRYNTISGWLIFLGFGIVFTPLSLTFQVIKQFIENANLNYYSIYFDEASNLYEPTKGYYILIVNALNIFLITSSVFIVIQFIKKKSSFRINYIYFKAFNLVFLLLDLTITYYFFIDTSNPEDSKLISGEAGSVFRIFIQSCIWIPYVWFSEKSRHTFTNMDEVESYTHIVENSTQNPAIEAVP